MAFDKGKHPRDPRTGRFISVGSKLAQEINAARSKQGAGKFPKLGAKLSGHETKAELQVVAKKAGISTKKSDTRAALIARIESGEKAKAPAAKPATKRGNANLRAAQERQERIDVQRAASIVAADIDEIRHKGADLELIQERLMTHAALLTNSPQHTRKGRRADLDALASNLRGLAGAKSVDAIQSDLRALQGDLGAKPVGKAGEKVAFDRKVHEPLAGDPQPGSEVEILRPGSRSDDGTLLERPVVFTTASPAEQEDSPAEQEERVLTAIASLTEHHGAILSLARLRAKLPELSDAEYALLMKRMDREQKLQLEIDPTRSSRLDANAQAAAVSIGGEDKHLVWAKVKPSEPTKAQPAGKASSRSSAPVGSAESQVVSAIQSLAQRPGDLVSLSRLRALMPDLSHDEFTALLKQMDRSRIIQLDPDPNRKALPSEARAAAITIGGEPKHLVSIKR